MEERVTKLEKCLANIDAQLVELKSLTVTSAKANDVAEIKGQLSQMPKAADFGRLEGRIQALPTTLQLIAMLIATWAADASIVFTALRLTGR
ncbi:MAG: hypothetical protein SH859_13820 [Hyphomicrobium aestuarii]|nr:hypothetical protein [Hyphomicrobium aestuarii]